MDSSALASHRAQFFGEVKAHRERCFRLGNLLIEIGQRRGGGQIAGRIEGRSWGNFQDELWNTFVRKVPDRSFLRQAAIRYLDDVLFWDEASEPHRHRRGEVVDCWLEQIKPEIAEVMLTG